MKFNQWHYVSLIVALAIDGLLVFAWYLRSRRLAVMSTPSSEVTKSWTSRLGAIPAGLIVPIILALGFAGQVSLDRGPDGLNIGLALLLACVAATLWFAKLDSSQALAEADSALLDETSPNSGFADILTNPRRTFFGTLALVASVACATQARDPANNQLAALLWLGGVITFLIAIWPAKPLPLEEWKPAVRKHWWELLLVAALLSLGGISRLYQLDQYPFGLEQDEANFGNDVLRMLNATREFPLFGTAEFFEHSASLTYLQSISIQLFGANEIGLRIPSGILGTIALAFSYLLARRMFGKTVGLISLGLLVFAPMHLLSSRMGIPDMIVMLTTIPTVMYFLYRGLTTGGIMEFGLSGLLLGIGLSLDYNNKIMIVVPVCIAIIIYVLVVRLSYWRTQYPKLIVFLCGALLTLIPIWTVWSSTGHLWMDPGRGKALYSPVIFEEVAQRFGTNDPVLVLAYQTEYSILSINHFGDISFMRAFNGTRPLLDAITGIFCFIGLGYSARHWRKLPYGFLLVCWGAGMQISIWSNSPPQFHRLMVILVPSYIAAVVGFVVVCRAWAALFKWPVVYVTTILVTVTTGVALSNLQTFFRPESHRGEWQTFCDTGKKIYEWLPDNTVYYFGAPRQFVTHGTIVFCSQTLSSLATDVENASEVVPPQVPTDKPYAMLFPPGNFDELDTIRAMYPNGQYYEWRDFLGEIGLKGYVVSKEDLNTSIHAVNSNQ